MAAGDAEGEERELTKVIDDALSEVGGDQSQDVAVQAGKRFLSRSEPWQDARS